MADIIAMSLQFTVLTGQAVRCQLLCGTPPNQWVAADLELTSVNAQSIAAGIVPLLQTFAAAATVGTVTTIDKAATSSVVLGYTNAQ